MMKTYAYTHKPERAFFLLDEMRTMDVQPDEDVFIGLLYAAATAPHHIQGYEDMLFQVAMRSLIPRCVCTFHLCAHTLVLAGVRWCVAGA